jgi:hypothetical protein
MGKPNQLGSGFNIPWTRNLTGGVYWAVLSTQKIGRRMVEAGSGSIINIATMYAVVAPNPQLSKEQRF